MNAETREFLTRGLGLFAQVRATLDAFQDSLGQTLAGVLANTTLVGFAGRRPGFSASSKKGAGQWVVGYVGSAEDEKSALNLGVWWSCPHVQSEPVIAYCFVSSRHLEPSDRGDIRTFEVEGVTYLYLSATPERFLDDLPRLLRSLEMAVEGDGSGRPRKARVKK